ncbi:hypothetical protein M514_06151 [Trichuris suis]|uniref:Uncharacterized protein n=1 Tax=Trichuris suis TaxID=68888 RepID=A0A085M739_9BILA|nr:hypothetical protein M513_06151 [Trichuris suis]KFD69824.1 hypothetical protein M514_06151 [Trichuris suis]
MESSLHWITSNAFYSSERPCQADGNPARIFRDALIAAGFDREDEHCLFIARSPAYFPPTASIPGLAGSEKASLPRTVCSAGIMGSQPHLQVHLEFHKCLD